MTAWLCAVTMVGTNMAILIPSKNIYDKQNPKVRDNVIERIEVGALEVVPDNEYGESVYNEKIIIDTYTGYNRTNTESDVRSFFRDSWTLAYGIGIAKTQITRMYCSGTIKIPKEKNNTVITEILSKIDSYGNAQIKYNAYCTKKTGSVSSIETLSETIYNPDSGAARIETSVSNNNINTDNRIFTDKIENTSLPDTGLFEIKDTIFFTQSYTVENNNYDVTATTTYPDNITNLGSLDVKYNEEKDEYEFDYIILCGIGFDRLGATKDSTFDIGSTSNTVTNTQSIVLLGETEFYFPKQIEITVYGNTIGIDLTDKTIYINGETAKKVHSIDGNELMQTSNYSLSYQDKINITIGGELSSATDTAFFELYYSETLKLGQSLYYNGEEAIITALPETENEIDYYTIKIKANGEFANKKGTSIDVFLSQIKESSITSAFTNTLNSYERGKETATIRCDISDYYEYDATAEKFKGEKVISIDNSTGQMAFKLYDKVIPMVYGSDKKDRPMSLYKNGDPKIFQVLGTKIYYNGAVWQELSLQEVDNN